MQKGNVKILLLVALLIVTFSIYYAGKTFYQSPSDLVDLSTTHKRPITGICDIALDYETNLKIDNTDDAEKAFAKYVTYMKTNKLKDSNLAVDWKFTKVEYRGFNKDLDYWTITFSYTMENGEKGNAQTNVNENGEIVRLLDCI